MKNILVPTDFSPLADSASEYALKIAEKAKAEIHFLHIQFTPVDWVKLDKEKEKNYPETLKQIGHAKNELHQWEKRAEDLGLKVRTFLTFDAGRDEIIKQLPPRFCGNGFSWRQWSAGNVYGIHCPKDHPQCHCPGAGH